MARSALWQALNQVWDSPDSIARLTRAGITRLLSAMDAVPGSSAPLVLLLLPYHVRAHVPHRESEQEVS